MFGDLFILSKRSKIIMAHVSRRKRTLIRTAKRWDQIMDIFWLNIILLISNQRRIISIL